MSVSEKDAAVGLDKAATPVKKRRVVQQRRSAESQRKLLDAAEQLFAEKGFQGTKVSDIIALSGCSVGSFYHQFTDKQGIFEVLYQQYLDATREIIESTHFTAEEEPDIAKVLQKIGMLALSILKAHVGARSAAEELVYSGQGELRDSAYSVTDQFVERMEFLVPMYALQIGHSQPYVALANALQMMAMVLTSYSLRPTKHLPDDDEQLVAVLVKGACGILEVKADV